MRLILPRPDEKLSQGQRPKATRRDEPTLAASSSSREAHTRADSAHLAGEIPKIETVERGFPSRAVAKWPRANRHSGRRALRLGAPPLVQCQSVNGAAVRIA